MLLEWLLLDMELDMEPSVMELLEWLLSVLDTEPLVMELLFLDMALLSLDMELLLLDMELVTTLESVKLMLSQRLMLMHMVMEVLDMPALVLFAKIIPRDSVFPVLFRPLARFPVKSVFLMKYVFPMWSNVVFPPPELSLRLHAIPSRSLYPGKSATQFPGKSAMPSPVKSAIPSPDKNVTQSPEKSAMPFPERSVLQ